MNDFNIIAPVYDLLARVVFGRAIKDAQCHYLSEVREQDEVLILGGGSGQLLDGFSSCHRLVFLDKSSRMIRRAKRRTVPAHIEFEIADFMDFNDSQKFDIIICPFFLDCFSPSRLTIVLSKINRILRPEGRLIVSDFQGDPDRLLFRSMHQFFRITASLDARRLSDIHSEVLKNGFEVTQEHFFLKNTIFSRIYRNL